MSLEKLDKYPSSLFKEDQTRKFLSTNSICLEQQMKLKVQISFLSQIRYSLLSLNLYTIDCKSEEYIELMMAY